MFFSFRLRFHSHLSVPQELSPDLGVRFAQQLLQGLRGKRFRQLQVRLMLGLQALSLVRESFDLVPLLGSERLLLPTR
jgi:hypothetical protein